MYLSNIISFVSGLLIGILGTYCGNRLLDKRRKKDSKIEKKYLFNDISRKMPELLKEMKDDFKDSDISFVREFYVLQTKGVKINTSEKYIAYYEDEHENLKNKISLLESASYVYNISEGQTLKYQITEEFNELLKKLKG
jgi:hypothetical protein